MEEIMNAVSIHNTNLTFYYRFYCNNQLSKFVHICMYKIIPVWQISKTLAHDNYTDLEIKSIFSY